MPSIRLRCFLSFPINLFHHQPGASALSRRPTITDVARTAGVSVATVDRVLNGRVPVREETARRVGEAAEAIGYHAAGLFRQKMRRELPECRLGFLLLRPRDPFYRAFATELEAAIARAEHFRGSAVIEFAETLAPEEIVERLDRLASRTQAVALVSPDHPMLTQAVAALKGRGVPVFSLLSDFAHGVRDGYVGVDNLKVGRSAAWIIARAARRPGRVALFVGHHRFHGHELREIGFRAFFRENAPDFTLLETLVNDESFRKTHEMLAALLRGHGELAGCYVAGGGGEGAISALREVRPECMPVTVCNELSPDRRAAMAEGLVTMVIHTPLPAISAALVAQMARALEADGNATPAQTFVPFGIHLPESI